MSVRRLFTLGALALSSAASHATVVNLVVDVAPTSGLTGLYDGTALQKTATPDFISQPFSMTVQFDLDNALIDQPMASNMGFNRYSDSIFSGGLGASSSPTPYTPALSATLPPQSTAIWPEFTQVGFGWSISTSLDQSVPQGPWESAWASTGSRWENVTPDQATITGYWRSFGLDQQGTPILPSQFSAKDGPQFVEWLKAQIGKTYVGAFNETYFYQTRKTVVVGDTVYMSGADDAITQWNTMEIMGNVTVRSVSYVPESSSGVLMALGLVGVTVIARKRSSSGA